MTVDRLDPIAEDERSRAFAQSEFGRPVVVVAGAGTGKTALLVARVAAWCVGPGWDLHDDGSTDSQSVARKVIERVVAITFTEAAAAEMARKIGQAFFELAAGTEPVGWNPRPGLLPEDAEEVTKRAKTLSEEGHRLVVSTIHAFCQRLLSTYPLEAGVHPRFEVDADGLKTRAIAEEVVEEALRGLAEAENGRSWERLAAEGVGPKEIVDAVIELIEAGAGPSLFDEDPFHDSGPTAARLRAAAGGLREAIGSSLDGVKHKGIAGARDLPDDLAEVTGDEASPSFEELADAASKIEQTVLNKLEKWAKHEFGKTELGCFSEDLAEVADAAGLLLAVLDPLTAPAREQLADSRAVIAPLLESVERRRMSAGLVMFPDLLRFAERLVSDVPGVRREVVAGIDHLLVDEFQDTDDVQCKLVERLALSGAPERRPALFIVGDPKQSIYAWRSADLAAYDEFVKSIRDAGGETVDLVRNFRSVTPILDEVERLVAPVMHQRIGIQPAFQRLEATDERRGAPGVSDEPWRTVEHWVAWPQGEDGVGPEKGSGHRETSALEAVSIARDIGRLHAEGVIERWGDVAILLRVTTAQEVLLDAFREAGIPYEVARERDYYRQREVVETAALVRSVLEPTDSLALLTVIRSDVVGVPDAALAPLWDAGFAGCMARADGPGTADAQAVAASIEAARLAAPEDVPGGDVLPRWADALQAAADVILELRRSLGSDPPDVFVEKIRTLWLAEVTAAARYLGSFRRARVDGFLADLESTLVSGDGGDSRLARFLRLAVEEGQESRVPVPPDLETDAVHVMTIHRAKGLDFEHVYVAQIHKGGRGGGRSGQAAVSEIGRVKQYQLFGWPTPGFAAAEWEQGLKARAEIVRLLYVAATRAKKRLVVSGGWGPAGEEVAPESASTFAKLIARRLDAGRVAEQIGGGAERVDDIYDHVTRVLPVFSAADEVEESWADGGSDWTVPVEQLRAAKALGKARRAAAERMALPVYRSASAEAHHRLRQAEADGEPAAVAGAADRDVAMALGTAVHSILETLDLERELVPQVLDRTASVVEAVPIGDPAEEAASTAENLLRKIAAGKCLSRLEELASLVVARELPVMAWDDGDAGAPGAVISGLVDLVYRDPDDDRVVVAVDKTDHVGGEAPVEEKTRVYEPQVRTYARALREALALDYEPHAELWFLAADQIVRLKPDEVKG